jgi:DNA-3-methyladenine glycosylase
MTDAAGRRPAERFIVDRTWFDRSSLHVAPDLLSMRLVHDTPAGRIAGQIVEVEAYLGPEDRAAHSSHGRTPRNAVMFGPPGHLYVYLIYGIHLCMNVVCGPGPKPEAVLIRAVRIDEGVELAQRKRGDVPLRRLAAGPGNVGRAFGIDRSLNGADLLTGPIRLAFGSAPPGMARRPRVGVDYAGDWAERPLRYLVADDPHISRR